MTPVRRIVVTLGLFALIGLHLFEVAIDSEHWPFCSYPMYSWLQEDDVVETKRVMGLRADTGAEIWLHGRRYHEPFDPSRLGEALLHIGDKADAKAWERALADMLQRYEQRRLAGHHDGPKLKGMRIYKMRHELHPEAKNLAQPEYRELLAEAEAR